MKVFFEVGTIFRYLLIIGRPDARAGLIFVQKIFVEVSEICFLNGLLKKFYYENFLTDLVGALTGF